MVEPNYFTCTLGEAARWKHQQTDSTKRSFNTIIGLVTEQARLRPQAPALNFADFNSESSASKSPISLTFKELDERSVSACKVLADRMGVSKNEAKAATVGVLSTSSVEFVLTWLGLMRMGYSVLLLAPQLEPRAIEHLCKTLKVDVVFVNGDRRHKTDTVSDVKFISVPPYEELPTSNTEASFEELRDPSEPAYFCHTSGTSSGLPKPIIQTHYGVVGALPCFPGENKPATFSTTPLYHGGLVDCFRSWTSGASIWLFPEGVVPITGNNLISAIKFARQKSPTEVGYFSSVPYVLRMLADEEEGIRVLRTIDLVGVGGAALPPAVGDRLVQTGVNLLSRMGSAECGFLMSSHRDYHNDKDWQYLRPIDDPKLLSFEYHDNGLSELIVKPDWPFLAKSNRPDGSYATGDLFEPHALIPNAWRYHSRADAQITLANGKKFDPSPLENAILSSTKLLQDVLIFGSGKDYAGALLFPASNEYTAEEVISSVWPILKKMNQESQSHARITRAMLVVIPVQKGLLLPLEKSSKGTIMRGQAEQRYANAIACAYRGGGLMSPNSGLVSDEQLLATVLNCFSQILGRDVDPYKDLYQQGVDSLSCIQIRKMIESSCLQKTERQLPMNVIYDQGTVAALVIYIRNIRQGTEQVNGKEMPAQLQEMRDLAEKYSNFGQLRMAPRRTAKKVVVLTGATGFLGAQILHLLRQDAEVAKIYCLLRAQSPFAAHERVTKALSKRSFPELEAYNENLQDGNERISCLPCNLSEQGLGLSDQDRQRILNEATVIIHSAWTVNFSLRLSSFEDQVAGTRNLINLAIESGAKFFFISSTASVSCSTSTPIPEKVSHNPAEASPLGYSQSKWVAEQVCASASNRLAVKGSTNTNEGPQISIIRVGQMCSNTSGVWNASEAYPLMLSTASLTGCLPDFPGLALNWIPVEQTAQAVLEIGFPGLGHANDSERETLNEPPVYHVNNPHSTPTWNQMLQWLLAECKESPFAIVSSKEWVCRLEKTLQEDTTRHPSQGLLAMWKDVFYIDADEKVGGEDTEAPKFDVGFTQKASGTMQSLKALDRDRILKMWTWVHENLGIKGC
ncbi:hypothetical protein QQZ08_009067 [Neonectria magnoliae]|uniref:Carrier domain-containing protein n=1 Tax=Neonectria magnoliae TaxID=2732573 RepID=A0ABR1HQ80_9HYPO